MSRWNRLGKHRACPVCGGERKDCRSLDLPNGITQYHCRTDNPNPDFELKKPDQLGFGIYFERAILDAQSQQQKEDWIRQRQAEKKAREEREAKEYAEGLPVELRDREFRKLLSQLSLNPNHRADLERRGLTPEQIEKGMFRSVSKDGTFLHTPISQYLPGAWDWGKSFKSPVDGYLCPILNDNGLIIGCQVRVDGGGYVWLKTKKSSHLQNGELPITAHITEGDKNLRLAEGILKPYIAHCRRGQTYLGAAGGNLASSPQQLKQSIGHIKAAQYIEKIILCPDAGSRANKNVLRQYRAIAKLLKSWGLTLWVEVWGQSDNKGNCDVDEIDPNTETKIIPFSEWDIEASKPKAKVPQPIELLAQRLQKKAEKLKRWWRKQRSFLPTIIQNQKYVSLEDKIPDGCIYCIKAPLGSGKTYQLAELFKPPYIDKKAGIYEESGQFYHDGAIMLGARNGLLLQNSQRLGFQHLQAEQCFSELHKTNSRIALCTDSLQHYLDPDWFNGKVLILDETMETIKHLLTSSTHRKNRNECLKLWSECLKRAKVIICLDGNLADWVIDEYILKFTGYRKVIKVENQYKGDRAPVEFLIGTSSKKSRLPENIEKPLKEKGLNSRDISPYIPMILASRCPAIVTDSQRKAEALEKILNMFGKKGVRVDSKTVADKAHPAKTFLEAPDKWIKANFPDFIILSPSAQSGIDISIEGYFSDVFALFFGVVGTDTQMQMPGRIRDPHVQWHIACPEYTRKEGENFSSPVVSEVKGAIENYLLQDAATISINLPEIMQHLEGLIKQGLKDNPHHDAYVKLKTKDNYEKANLRECLIEALGEAGHEIKLVELQHNDEGSTLLKDASEEILNSEATDIFKAPDTDPDKVQELSAKFDATWEERCQIIKAGYKSRLPGIEDTKIWSKELIYIFRKYRNFISQSELHYFLYHPEHIQEQQQELWGYLALGGIKFLADVRSRHLKIKALEKLKIKYFLESDRLWTCHDPEIKELLTTARRSKKLSAALGIVPGKDAIKYLKQVVGLVGYEVRLEKREAVGNRYYKILPVKNLGQVSLDLELVRKTLSKCLAQKYDPTTVQDEGSKSKWAEAQAAISLTSQNKSRVEAEPMSDAPSVLIRLGENGTENQLDLVKPPPEIPRGDLVIYQEDMKWTADCLELMIDTPPQQQPDLSPLEVFKHQVGIFGWNVIKEAAKLNEALANKVIGLVEQLVLSGEWNFAPG